MKKLVSLLVVFVLLLALAACAGTGGSSAPAQAGSAGSEAAEAEAGPVTPAGELPVVPEGTDITLTVAAMGTPMIADYETNYFTKWVEDNTGVKLDFVLYPMDTILEKTLLELSSGNVESLPDIYLARGFAGQDTLFTPSYAPRWYDEGMIIPLNDLIEKYGYHYQLARDLAAESGYTIEQWITSADGNIYSMPSFSASLTNSYPHKLWINKGWLEALDLEVPTTTEEFQVMLEAFRDDDPNGNGQQDEIPFAGYKATMAYGYDYIINAFIYNQSNFTRVTVEDGKVGFAPTEDAWRDAMIYLRGLADADLYYDGSFTQDLTTMQQIALNENDILGCFEGLGFDGVLSTADEEVLARWTWAPAFTGPDGAHFVSWNAPSTMANGTITAGCEHPEVAFRVLDFMMSYEGSLITRYGEKGVNWDDADPDSITYYGTPAMLKILENTWATAGQNQNFLQQSPFILDPAIATGVQWGGDELEAGYIKAQAVMLLDETGVVPEEFIANLVFTEEELDSVTGARVDIDGYIVQSVANFIAGDWDPADDAQWESYKAEFDKMGLEDFLATVQAAYDRQQA